MRQLLITLFCIVSFGSLYAIDNNVELIGNKDFSNSELFKDSVTGFAVSYAKATVRGKWYAGDISLADYNNFGFTTSIANGYFESTIPYDAALVYNNFLGQVPSVQLNTGRYHLSLKAKGTAPFYIKISSVAAMGTELSSILRNASSSGIEKQTIADYAGYSIKVTPNETWTTYSADIDLSIATANYVRIFIVFPKTGEISLDDISLMRTKDLPTSFYIRPSGNTTAWTSLPGIDPDQILTGDAISLVSTNTYYMSTGSYTTPTTITMTTGKIYGGFSGNETSIDLNARATSDLDQNGIVEPWEFTNVTSISGLVATSKYDQSGATLRLLTISGGEVDGVTLTDYNYLTYGGTITLGQVNSNPTDNTSGSAGKLTRCIVRKMKGGAGVIMSTNGASVIDRCLIEDNTGTTSYGAVYLNKFGGTVSNSVIRNNKATTKGGAIYGGNATTSDLNAIVKNCVIYNNTALQNGGAIAGDALTNSAGVEIVNSTIVNNTTTSPGTASVELNNNGLLVNSIVLNDPLDEIAINSISNYVERVAYGTYVGASLYPALLNISGKSVTDFNFVNPTPIQGYVGLSGADYDVVHKANFSINNQSSAAYVSLATIPTSYQIGGSGSTITTHATVPTTDITGAARSDNLTIGAYYYNPFSAVKSEFADKLFSFGCKNNIEVNGIVGEVVSIYNVSGQFIKSVKLTYDKTTIPATKGFYIVVMGALRNKVVVD